jgi:O-acetyl-ADP-ribose deacetylase (regulator of RNase III)
MKRIKVKKAEIVLKKGDITEEDVDIIVNATNSLLAGGAGVDEMIREKGGPAISRDCRKLQERFGGCPIGEAVITSAGNLKALYLIHTVGPRWNRGEKQEIILLKNAYINSLRLANKLGISSIAFPAISTGANRFPVKLAAMIAIQSVIEFLNHEENILQEVRFVLYDDKTLNAFNQSLMRIQEPMQVNSGPRSKVRATRSSWKTQPLPEEWLKLPFDLELNKKEFGQIKYGFIPREMDDQWFIFFEENKLYFYRSWTGYCIYEVEFEQTRKGARVKEVWVNNNPKQHKIKNMEALKGNLIQLIQYLLEENNYI